MDPTLLLESEEWNKICEPTKLDGKEYILQAGDTLVMPAKKPHSVYAKEDFKWLLTVVFPS